MQNKENSAPERSEYHVLFISSDRLGDGPEELGTRLCGAFLDTLAGLGTRPDKIIFMNSGVKLVAAGSRVLEELQRLATAGVDILACGTCLGYFELTDRVAVGRVSNMHEIVGLLMTARRLVTL